MYIGVHVPKSFHRRRRHRRKSSHKERRERTDHGAEGYKSDGENVDDAAASLLKPLSESDLAGSCLVIKSFQFFRGVGDGA